MKRRLLVSAIVASLLLSILPFFPVGATEPTGWSKPRPTTDRLFNNTLGNAAVSADGQAALTLGVNIGKYVTGGSGGVDDNLEFHVDVAANTREGIDYEWSTAPFGFSWVNVNQPVGISGDNTGVLFQLNFPVLYYGVNYSSVWVCSNGFVSFTSANYAGASPCSLPNSSMQDAIVAPFWRKLKLSQGGSIKTGHIVNSWPGDNHMNSYQVFTWDNIPDENNHNQTFQLLIEDRIPVEESYHNLIYFQFLSVTTDAPTTIGVQDRLGRHGQFHPLSQISNNSPGGMNTYTMGYRLTSLEYTVTKQDSQAKLNPLETYKEGWNVDLNSSGTHHLGFWGTVVEAGVSQLFDLCGAGVVIDGLFLAFDMTSALAADTYYTPSSGSLVCADTDQNQASGIVYCHSQSPYDGSYCGMPFDASFGNSIFWFFTDQDRSQSHTITVTATAGYVDNFEHGGSVSTSVVLNIYHGYHYVDIYTNLYPSGADISGMPIEINGQIYPSPVDSLILPEGQYIIQAMNTNNRVFLQWSNGNGSYLQNVGLTGDFEYNVTYEPIWTLTIYSEPGGTTNPQPGAYTYLQNTLQGTAVPVTATPSVNYTFGDWYLNGTFYSDSASISVTMNANYVLTPTFIYHGGQSGGGCPYVYGWNGTSFVRDNNILPASETGNGTDTQDYYLLQQPLAPVISTQRASLYSLQIREFENNTDYIDQVKLMAVGHSQGTSVAVTPEGQIVTFTNPTSPLSCVDNYGNSRLSEMSLMDGNVSDPSTYFQGFKDDSLVLNFGKVTEPYANLILRDDQKCCEDNCIKVQVPDRTGGWQTIEVLHPRDFWSMEAVNMTACIPANGDFIVRLL